MWKIQRRGRERGRAACDNDLSAAAIDKPSFIRHHGRGSVILPPLPRTIRLSVGVFWNLAVEQ